MANYVDYKKFKVNTHDPLSKVYASNNAFFDALATDMSNVKEDVANSGVRGHEVSITHNLSGYPLVRTMVPYDFGHSGFGQYGFGESVINVQVPTKLEYRDENTAILHLDENFVGTPSVTSLGGNAFEIAFSGEETVVQAKFITV